MMGEKVADELIDLHALNEWINSVNLPGDGPITSVERLTGGTQMAVFLLKRGEVRMVLRRPPKHPRPTSNKTMIREARVLEALSGSGVPHPRFLAACDDASVMGVNFYLMEELEGFSPKGPLPGKYATDPAWRYEMAIAVVHAEAALATVDYIAVGLEDFGKAHRWHERQVERWLSELESYTRFEGYRIEGGLGIDTIARWLSGNLPKERRIGIIHGDLNWQNMMFRWDRPTIAGLIDWEMSTLGDPMLDLAWTMTSGWDAGDPEGHEPLITPWQGFPTRREMVELYCQLTRRNADSFRWLFVLACYKLAIVMQGTCARAVAGQTTPEQGARFDVYSRRLLMMAHKEISKG